MLRTSGRRIFNQLCTGNHCCMFPGRCVRYNKTCSWRSVSSNGQNLFGVAKRFIYIIYLMFINTYKKLLLFYPFYSHKTLEQLASSPSQKEEESVSTPRQSQEQDDTHSLVVQLQQKVLESKKTQNSKTRRNYVGRDHFQGEYTTAL